MIMADNKKKDAGIAIMISKKMNGKEEIKEPEKNEDGVAMDQEGRNQMLKELFDAVEQKDGEAFYSALKGLITMIGDESECE